MISLNGLEISSLGNAIGWSLIHSLWQISLVAFFLYLGLRFIPQKKPRFRYAFLLLGLLSIVVWSGLTFVYLWDQQPAQVLVIPSSDLPQVEVLSTEASPAVTTASFLERFRWFERQLNDYMPAVIISWLLGMLLCWFYLISGLFHLHYLQRHKVTLLSPEWNARFDHLCQQMRVSRKVGLYISEIVDEPITFQFLKPVILLPVSLFTGLTTTQIEVLILHELAHIRRRDFAVNLLQTLIEILFFYHPALWWISRKVREEREHCCDDAVLAIHNDPVLYSEALTQIQLHHFSPKKRLVMSATGNKSALSKRVFRLFGQYDQQPPLYRSILMVSLLLLLSLSSQAFFVASPAPTIPLEASNTIAEPIVAAIVKGVVYDESSQPLIGANILIKGLKIGTISDMEGRFELRLPEDCATLVISYVGMETRELENSCGGQTFDVILKKKVSTSPTQKETATPALVSGTVYDDNKRPLIGVSILIKGTTIGTITDLKGNFTLRMPKDCETLLLNYVGMETRELENTCNGEMAEIIMIAKEQASPATIIPSATAESPALTIITGTVLDENSKPLIGTSVLIKDSKMGTITDLSGDFQIRLPENCATLVFSYSGMETWTTEELCGAQTLDVVLKKKEEVFEEATEETKKPSLVGVDISEAKGLFSDFKVYPNPSSDLVNIGFDLKSDQRVKVSIYTADGKLVKTLLNQSLRTGPQAISWSIGPNGKGAYLVQMEIKNALYLKRLIVE
jgi:beta-lactamase regulating signal transducer with metallopeptidase domain